jgi:flagellar biosynthesis chaperone FliJ
MSKETNKKAVQRQSKRYQRWFKRVGLEKEFAIEAVKAEDAALQKIGGQLESAGQQLSSIELHLGGLLNQGLMPMYQAYLEKYRATASHKEDLEMKQEETLKRQAECIEDAVVKYSQLKALESRQQTCHSRLQRLSEQQRLDELGCLNAGGRSL